MREIQCKECMWTGDSDGLLCSDADFNSTKTTDQIKFNICPDCGAVDCFEDYEE